jgi:hypothetical protein
MDDRKLPETDTRQPLLFHLGEASAQGLEFYPAVWSAAEALTASDPLVRQMGLEELEETQAARYSPLIVYLLITMLTDPDIDLRCKVIHCLTRVIGLDEDGKTSPEVVRQCLCGHLGALRTREVYALLQAVEHKPVCEDEVVTLLSCSSYAGNHLADILNERGAPLGIRRLAARFIGRVGFLSALPAVDRLASRLETRHQGQQAMPFAPRDAGDEVHLLPELRLALELLRAP